MFLLHVTKQNVSKEALCRSTRGVGLSRHVEIEHHVRFKAYVKLSPVLVMGGEEEELQRCDCQWRVTGVCFALRSQGYVVSHVCLLDCALPTDHVAYWR